MAALTFAAPKPPASEDAVSGLETTLGVGLPADYRQFLLTANGGQPESDELGFAVRWPNPALARTGATSLLDTFYALGVGPAELGRAVRAYDGRVPHGHMPIAADPFGNQLVLGLAGPARGHVAFWLHDLPADLEETDPANLGAVAESFDAFVAGLRERDG